MTRSRWTLPLFLFLAALHIAPVWAVRYLPTGDGPAHVYNAWILHGLLAGDAPPNIERAYRVDWSPHPNWSGHALMALAMTVVPPLVAEKLLVTLILALLFFGAWHLATTIDPGSDVHAFFVFPFAWPQTLIAGYYNYSLSVGLFLIILATWWRRRMWMTAALLVVCYFTHPMATLLACGAIGMLSVVERRWTHLLAIVPVAPLLLFFGGAEQSNVRRSLDLHVEWGAARLLGTAEVMQSLDAGQQRFISTSVALLFAILAAVTIRRDRQRPANALALLVLAFAAMMFWIPAASGTRDLFTQRTSQFLFPVLAAWLTPRIAGRWRVAVAAALSLLALANLAIVWRYIRWGGAENAAYVRKFRAVEPETAMLPLLFTRPQSGTVVDLFTHRTNYVALEKRLVDYSNYEPASRYFPVAWREEGIDSPAIELAPGSVDLARYAARAEYVVTIGMQPGTPQHRDLQRLYSLTHVSDELRIYRRHTPLRGAFETILLPLLGTRTDLGAPHGVRWRIDQRIINRGSRPVRAVFEDCLEDIPCDLELAPNEMIPIAARDRRFVLLRAPQGLADQLQIDTVVRRADLDRPDLSFPIPFAHERAFGRGAIRIENVPARDRKVGLRIYVFSGSDWHEGTIRLHAAGNVAGEHHFATAAYYENPYLDTFGAETVDIEVLAPPSARVWAFATSANRHGQTQVITPGS